MTLPYEKELRIAQLAVQRAVILTKTVLSAVDKGARSKSDNSPVTVADFGAQALLISAVQRNFPGDSFVGEESAAALREDEKLYERVWELVQATRLEDEDSERALGKLASPEEMLDAIDRGAGDGVKEGRVWILDPIDGTKAFVSGGQYVVCLALVEDGEQKVGVLGCPNLDLDVEACVSDLQAAEHIMGMMASAVLGQGTLIRPLSRRGLLPSRRIEKCQRTSLKPRRFVDSSSSRTTNLETHRLLASNLGAAWPGTEITSLQMRYVAIALGKSDVMIRIPRDAGYREPVWDHAGGVLILQEAGGKVTDLDGKTVDFGRGRRLQTNHGFIATSAVAYADIFKAARKLLDDRRP